MQVKTFRRCNSRGVEAKEAIEAMQAVLLASEPVAVWSASRRCCRRWTLSSCVPCSYEISFVSTADTVQNEHLLIKYEHNK